MWVAREVEQGSSPRMRGAPNRAWLPAIHRGIIPADAGSTNVSFSLSWLRKDHPRGCGEHS